MLKKQLFVFIFLVLLSKIGLSQCGNNLPDTVCPFQNITISQGLINISVNTCTAVPTNTVNISPPLATNFYQFKIIKENNRYFAFGQAIGSGYMNRIEFNSDFTIISSNSITPVPAASVNQHVGSEMVKNSAGKWIALLPASDDFKFLRLEFDSIDDPNPTPTDIAVPEFNLAKGCKVIEHYLFVTNNASTITRMEFDSDFQNILSVVNIPGPFIAAYAIDIEYDCETGNYFGFVADDFSKIVRYDFGPSLDNNNPPYTILSSVYSETIGIDVAKIKDSWYMFTNNFGPLNRYLQFKMDSINGNIVLMVDTINTSLNPYSVTVFTDSSKTRVFPSANFAFIDFVDSACIALQNTWFEDSGSVVINFQPTALGYQYITIEGLDTNNVHQVYYDSVYVNIPPPVSFFTTNGTCEGLPVNFTDASTICYGAITSWFWDFGDGDSSTQQNPSHTYLNGGVYLVTLTVYAANGDSGIFYESISVVPLPNADFTISSNTSCTSYAILFNDVSTAVSDSIVSWLWSFGNPDSSILQNPTYTYNTVGNFAVLLTVTNSNGCTDSVSQIITILPSPIAAYNLTGTCVGGTVLFENLTDSATNDTINYKWFFGDNDSSAFASPAHVYSAIDSTYQVQLIATAINGCLTTFIDSVSISFPAAVSFTQSADTVCKNVPVQFINTSFTTGSDSIIKTSWYFSDGFTIDNADTVMHAFTGSGLFYVTLTAITPTYCDTSYSSSIFVLDNPHADFIFTNTCFNDSNLLVSTSTPVAGDNISSYFWNFGDNSTFSNATSVYHRYSNPGIYNATLTVNSIKGCSDSIQKSVDVFELPIANFIPASVLCSDSANHFVDFSFINSNDTLVNWLWSFGDLNTSTIQNPDNNYSLTGTYQVQLIVGSQKGCIDTMVKAVVVKQSPSPSFTFDSLCFGNLTKFNFVNLFPSTSLINAWNWNFGEFGTGNSTLQNPAHQYAQPATYMVTVTATDTNKCFSDFTQPVTIYALPLPGYAIDNPCKDSPTLFTDTSLITVGTISQWQWMVNGNSISTANTANYIFNQQGNYPVQLTVTSNNGCSSSIAKSVAIFDLPVASFTYSPPYGAPNQLVTFTNTSANAVSYSWAFGDGSFSNQTSPTHAYADTISYQVSLIAISDKGCVDTATDNYNVLVPVLEIAITDVAYQIKNNLMSVTAQLVNLGNIDITNFDITARFDETPVLVELSTQPITVSTPTLLYTFKSKIEINTGFNPAYYCIEVSNPNGSDDYQGDNTKCEAIDNTFQLLNLAPNPVNDLMQLYINSPYTQELKLTVNDMLGRLVISTTSKVKKGFNFIYIDTAALNNGLYVLLLDNGTYNLKSVFEKQ